MLFITILSILGIAFIVWVANAKLPFAVCPVCSGVLLTWVWLLGAYYVGYDIPLVLPAILMGGSVVGSTYQLEKKFRELPMNTLRLWKTVCIPGGFVFAYALLEGEWNQALFAIIFLVVLLIPLLISRNREQPHKSTSDLEKKMERCC